MARIHISKPWQNISISLVNYIMVILLAMTLAYWIWVFFKPAPIAKVVLAEAPAQTLLPNILAAHWFNQNASQTVVADNSNLKLLGVFSSTAHYPGFAIFKLADGKQTHAVLNHEISAGTQLVNITKNSVTISQNGVESKLMLEDAKASTLSNADKLNTQNTQAPNNNTGGFNIQSLMNKK